jgi:hypothetical protein
MKNHKLFLPALILAALLCGEKTLADNPLILDQFTADPTARVFDGKIFVYPSHDIDARLKKGRPNWFNMEDYHVFSSENLIDWQDHGVIVSQSGVEWTNPTAYSMWAPDCVLRNGKYYFYFPAPAKPAAGVSGRRQRIGVAIAEKPAGPFKPQATPIDGVSGIDPCVFIDKDGQAYLYTAQGRISVAKLKENMLELDSAPQVIPNLPTVGLIEGPFMFERNGNYYLTFPHVHSKTERLEYAMGKSPAGPFTMTGVIMDESPSGCWTNHHSIVQYKGQWYLFYHDMDLSPDFDKNRSIRADYLSFNEDGTIQKVIPTLRGVGIKDAKANIQIDRYSSVSKQGTSVAFLDNVNKQLGWKITLSEKNAWVQYDRVDFGTGDLKSVNVRSLSSTGGLIEIRLDKPDSPAIAELEIGKSPDWHITNSKLMNVSSGVHDVIVSSKEKNDVELDWVSFE